MWWSAPGPGKLVQVMSEEEDDEGGLLDDVKNTDNKEELEREGEKENADKNEKEKQVRGSREQEVWTWSHHLTLNLKSQETGSAQTHRYY